MRKPRPPGRHQEQASKQRCTFSPARSVQFSSKPVEVMVANTKAVLPLTAHAGGRLGMVGATRAAAYPMGTYVHRLVTTSFRPIIPLSLPEK